MLAQEESQAEETSGFSTSMVWTNYKSLRSWGSGQAANLRELAEFSFGRVGYG